MTVPAIVRVTRNEHGLKWKHVPVTCYFGCGDPRTAGYLTWLSNETGSFIKNPWCSSSWILTHVMNNPLSCAAERLFILCRILADMSDLAAGLEESNLYRVISFIEFESRGFPRYYQLVKPLLLSLLLTSDDDYLKGKYKAILKKYGC